MDELEDREDVPGRHLPRGTIPSIVGFEQPPRDPVPVDAVMGLGPSRPVLASDHFAEMQEQTSVQLAMRALEKRVEDLASQMPELATLARTILELRTRLERAEQVVGYLSQQRGVAEHDHALRLRSMALDAALKAVGAPHSPATDSGLIQNLFEVFQAMLRGGN